jgi:hypothetical protein
MGLVSNHLHNLKSQQWLRCNRILANGKVF